MNNCYIFRNLFNSFDKIFAKRIYFSTEITRALYGNMGTDTDIDECSTGSAECDSKATCTNTEGSFTCTCVSGYIGGGFSCNGNLV